MSLWQNIGGTWRKGTLWQNVAGTWRKVTVCANVGGTWKKDASGGGGGGSGAFSVSAGPDYVYGSVNRINSTKVYTNATTVTPVGGTAPYRYSWNQPGTMMVEFPTAATTRFSGTVSGGQSDTSTFTCTVTDASGLVRTTTVTAAVDNYYSGGKGAQIQ